MQGARRSVAPLCPPPCEVALALSYSGTFLAALSSKGIFKVLEVADLRKVLDVANIDSRGSTPEQMVWSRGRAARESALG